MSPCYSSDSNLRLEAEARLARAKKQKFRTIVSLEVEVASAELLLWLLKSEINKSVAGLHGFLEPIQRQGESGFSS